MSVSGDGGGGVCVCGCCVGVCGREGGGNRKTGIDNPNRETAGNESTGNTEVEAVLVISCCGLSSSGSCSLLPHCVCTFQTGVCKPCMSRDGVFVVWCGHVCARVHSA